jgi:DNA-binding NtrC family response regulator
MSTPRVLVVDDDPLFCESLVDHFAGKGLATVYVTSLRDAALQPLERFGVVVIDNHLPDGNGLTLVDAAIREGPGPSFIMVTGDPSYEHAVTAMRSRVADYLSKPIALEALTGAVMRVFLGGQARAAPPGTSRLAPATSDEWAAASTRGALPEELARFAQSDLPILVTGETGTGKTRLAQQIHLASPRARGPFISINCATLAESIVEAELFGASRGAFTGASERPGLLALGDGGTLLLDEIGELPASMQAKLLSVLEERRVRRIGASRWQALDVRIVAATHVDLADAVATGRFRPDLLYRLDVGRMVLPPLRERPHVLPDAVAQLLAELGGPDARLAEGELERLVAHSWPGNFRELRNALARALVLHPAEALRPSACLTGGGEPTRAAGPIAAAGSRDRASRSPASVPAEPPAALTLAELERCHVLATLAQHGGHRARTAQALGISEVTLRRKLRAWDQREP